MVLSIALAILIPTTWIVDQANGPGTNFIDLPPAVAAAATGDTIIVRAGSYTPFVVTGKALTILGAGAGSVWVTLPLPASTPHAETRILGVPAGATFYVSGLAFAPHPFPTPSMASSSAGLMILGGAGAVVLSDVLVVGAPLTSAGANPALVASSAEVHVSRCTFAGGQGGYYQNGGSAAVVNGGAFAASDSVFNGGMAVYPYNSGGRGLEIQSAPATLSRCSATGGSGGVAGGAGVLIGGGGVLRAAGTAAQTFEGGDAYWIPGAPAVEAPGGTAMLHGNITLLPGSGALYGPGPSTVGAVTTGAAPLPYLAVTGMATASGDLVATQPVTVILEGLIPSAPFALAIDAAPGFTMLNGPIFLGELLVPVPPAVILEGVLDALGMFQLTTTPAVSVPSVVGVPLYAQFGVLDAPEANVRLSNGQIRRFE